VQVESINSPVGGDSVSLGARAPRALDVWMSPFGGATECRSGREPRVILADGGQDARPPNTDTNTSAIGSDLDHDFAEVRAGFEILEGGHGLFEWEDAIDDRMQIGGCDRSVHRFEHRP
jgi:hypothetical protein